MAVAGQPAAHGRVEVGRLDLPFLHGGEQPLGPVWLSGEQFRDFLANRRGVAAPRAEQRRRGLWRRVAGNAPSGGQAERLVRTNK